METALENQNQEIDIINMMKNLSSLDEITQKYALTKFISMFEFTPNRDHLRDNIDIAQIIPLRFSIDHSINYAAREVLTLLLEHKSITLEDTNGFSSLIRSLSSSDAKVKLYAAEMLLKLIEEKHVHAPKVLIAIREGQGVVPLVQLLSSRFTKLQQLAVKILTLMAYIDVDSANEIRSANGIVPLTLLTTAFNKKIANPASELLCFLHPYPEEQPEVLDIDDTEVAFYCLSDPQPREPIHVSKKRRRTLDLLQLTHLLDSPDSKIQQDALKDLIGLTFEGGEEDFITSEQLYINQSSFRNSGGIVLLIELLKVTERESTKRYALEVLNQVVNYDNTETHIDILATNAIALLVRSLYSSDEQTQLNAAKILINLINRDHEQAKKIKDAIQEANGIVPLNRLINSSNPAISDYAKRMLDILNPVVIPSIALNHSVTFRPSSASENYNLIPAPAVIPAKAGIHP